MSVAVGAVPWLAGARGCSSIDPFPRRRWILGGILVVVLLAMFDTSFLLPGAIAARRVSQEISKASSCSAERYGTYPNALPQRVAGDVLSAPVIHDFQTFDPAKMIRVARG